MLSYSNNRKEYLPHSILKNFTKKRKYKKSNFTNILCESFTNCFIVCVSQYVLSQRNTYNLFSCDAWFQYN